MCKADSLRYGGQHSPLTAKKAYAVEPQCEVVDEVGPAMKTHMSYKYVQDNTQRHLQRQLDGWDAYI